MLPFEPNASAPLKQSPFCSFLYEPDPGNVKLESGDFGLHLVTISVVGEKVPTSGRNNQQCVGAGKTGQIADMGKMRNEEGIQP